MQLLASRTYQFIDSESLVERNARDTLFRVGGNKFLLHMGSSDNADDDSLVWLDCRAALLWVNESTEEFGMNWK